MVFDGISQKLTSVMASSFEEVQREDLPLVPLSRAAVEKLTSRRPHEVKLGEVVHVLLDDDDDDDDLMSLRSAISVCAATCGCRYALLGVPEDVGPRANCGRGGAAGGWSAFLPAFLNMQDNDTLPGAAIVVLGHVRCADIMEEANTTPPLTTDALRALVPRIDTRVEAVAKAAFEAGLELVVVGGGHNNCLPLLRAARGAAASSAGSDPSAPIPAAVACNLDPHLDIRCTSEGRHSGNGFSTALEEGTLGRYCLCGYHRRYNSAASLAALRRYDGAG